MPVERIENLPAGTRLFLDANIFVYAFLGHSNPGGQGYRVTFTIIFGIPLFSFLKAAKLSFTIRFFSHPVAFLGLFNHSLDFAQTHTVTPSRRTFIKNGVWRVL